MLLAGMVNLSLSMLTRPVVSLGHLASSSSVFQGKDYERLFHLEEEASAKEEPVSLYLRNK